MRRFFAYVSWIILLSFLFTAVFLRYFGSQEKGIFHYLSPIPDFLTLSKNSQVRLLDLWFPSTEDAYGSGFDISNLTAHSVLMYDLTTNKAVFEKNPREKLPMASLTKIMTAIIALENKRSDDRYVVRKENLVGEDSMGLSEGETLPFEDLIYGLMLPSGNDAAEVLAANYAGGRSVFIEAMNDKAKALGLTDTHFSNPSGLQGDGIQHTTTYDLLVMTRYALDNFPLFAKVVSTASYDIAETSTHKAYTLFNETNLLTTYQGVKGVKTGYTPEAGLCLITYIDYGGHKIIGIILNSENRRGEMKELLDYSLKSLDVTPPPFEAE
jgi:D-alanyl-D-alanine carboxypeptidase (penicillin-binding protein 5/6)